MRKNNFAHLKDGTTLVHLTRNKTCILNTSDWETLKHRTWHAAGHVDLLYACSNQYSEGKVRKPIRMHREIMRPPEGMVVDHINHNTLDNRRCNLRICTPRQNTFNQYRKYTTEPKRKGVYFFRRTGRWYSQISLNGVNTYLGYFDTAEEAAQAYDVAAKQHFGEFACLNFA